MASAGAAKKEKNAGDGQHLLWNDMERNDKRNIAATPHTKNITK